MTTQTVVTFPMETLTPFPKDQPPNAGTVRKLARELHANAAAVPCPAGGGNHGHVGMIMPAAQYATLPGTIPWVDPAHPGVLAPGGAAAAIAAANIQWKVDMNVYDTSIQVRNKLKLQILVAVPDAYTNALADPLVGYAAVTPAQLLAHLTATYGTITAEDLTANENKLTEPWDPATPTELVFDRAAQIQSFAANTEPITDGKVVRDTLQVFENSGVLGDACKDWKKKPLAHQTLANMRTHFREYNARRLRDSATASQHGYGTAAAVTTQDPQAFAAAILAAMQQQATCPPTGAPLTDQLQTLLANAASQSNNGRRNNTSNGNAAPNDSNQFYYCWTHGLSRNPRHTSQSCNTPAQGHQATATLQNMQGGNNTIARRRNERQVYRRPNSNQD